MKLHIAENKWQYLLITLIFVLGVIIGDYKVTGLAGGIKSHLLSLIDEYIKGGINSDLNKEAILFNSFLNQAKSILAIWFLGLTVIGMPIILGVVFYKGFSLGFTIAFLVKEKAVSGILISILSILPQNLVYIPLIIIWSVIGINFSVYIARSKAGSIVSLGGALISYTLLMIVFLAIVLVGAFIETYLSPWFLSLFV
ncbi:MAG: stage II sporulation protein M [Syntrophomonas sp.]|nr:stage II sporulation protein M [Syntrophomonas sp.]